MSNPTELPDLERIAAALYSSLDDAYQSGILVPDAPAASSALHEYSLYRSARRAQPEGEAPQAEQVADSTLLAALRKYGAHLHTCECVDGGEIDPSLEEYCDCGLNAILESAAPAAQQAAAPGAIPDQSQFEAQAKYQGATDFTLVHPDFARCNNGWEPATYRDPMTELAWRVWANKRLAASAPGTPEAPAVGKSLLRPAISATNPLPPGCYCKPGQCAAPVIMGRQTPCRDPAKRAAQLDGGQEGSESNG